MKPWEETWDAPPSGGPRTRLAMAAPDMVRVLLALRELSQRGRLDLSPVLRGQIDAALKKAGAR